MEAEKIKNQEEIEKILQIAKDEAEEIEKKDLEIKENKYQKKYEEEIKKIDDIILKDDDKNLDPNIDSSTKAKNFVKKKILTTPFILIWFITIPIILFIISFFINTFALLFIYLFFVYIVYQGLKKRFLIKIYKKYAESKGYKYAEYDWDIKKGSTYFSKSKKYIIDIFSTKYQEKDILVYTTNIVIETESKDINGNRRKSESTTSYLVSEIAYDFKLPHILLSNDILVDMNNSSFLKVFNLKLNHLFDEKFKLLIDEGLHIEVLQILTQDIMEFLMNNYAKYSIETFEDKMYLIQKFNFTEKDFPSYLENMFQDMKTLNDKLVNKFISVSKDVVEYERLLNKDK